MKGLGLIRNKSLAHTIALQRLRASEVQFTRAEVSNLNARVYGRVASLLAKLKGRGGFASRNPFDTSAYSNLIDAVETTVSRGYQQLLNQFAAKLVSLGEYELEYQAKLLADSLGIVLKMPSSGDVLASVKTRPIHGLAIGEHFDRLTTASINSIKAEINRGILEGLQTSDILRNLESTSFALTGNQVEAVTGTAVTHTANHSREALWDSNGDEIIGVVYVAVLDTHTTLICASLNGNVYELDDGPRPPQHYECRSTTWPVTKKFGAPKVPETDEWLRGLTNKELVELFGETRAKWYQDGKIKSIRQLVDQSNRPLTLNEIRRSEGLR